MKVKIEKTDHTGHSTLAEFDTEKTETVKVAQTELEKFLADCVKQYGRTPPVWARRLGEKDYKQMEQGSDLLQYDALLVQHPIVGG